MKHSKGYRTRGRKILRKHPREKGRQGLSRLLYKYRVGDKVSIDISPSRIETAPHRRYQGRTGIITEMRGKAYIVKVTIGKKEKFIITTPEHLKPHPD